MRTAPSSRSDVGERSLTQGVAGLVLPGTDVQSSEENSVIVPLTAFPYES